MKYKITITPNSIIFNDLILNAEIEAESIEKAIQEVKEHYAMELGTFEEEVQILEVVKL